jgi:NAD+ diphosphatase
MRIPVSEILSLPLAQVAFDRDYLRRQEPDLFDQLWADADTRVLVVFDGKVLLAENSSLRLLSPAEVPSAQVRAYLGLAQVAGAKTPVPVVLAMPSANSANALEPDHNAWHQLRRTGSGLGEVEAALLATGLALANWHKSHEYCAACGSITVVEQGGWVRRCLNDEKELFPRTDPAIIVSVVDADDRILLGSQGVWEDNRWSVLAGFVEPGESLSHAVVREVFEEAGVQVVEPKFLGSQSWPYPYSLMVGFTARVAADFDPVQTTPDGVEIEKLRWFSREELLAEAGEIFLPGRLSIARALIEHWLGQSIRCASDES